VQRAALERTQRLLLDTQNKVQVGAAPPLEEKLAESQVETVQSEIAVAEQALKEREDALRNLFVDDLKDWRDVSVEPAESLQAVFEPFDRTESWQNAMTKRPELLQLRVDLERQDIVLRYDRNQLFPALDLVGGYGWNAAQSDWDAARSDLGHGTYPTYSYGIVLSIPLGNRSARNTYKAGQEAKMQSLLRLKKLEIDIMTQVEDTGNLVETSFRRVGSTRKAREYAQLALGNEESKLQNGQSTSFLVLEFQRRLTAARSAELRSLADHNRARAQLALSEGTTLERNNIILNFR
jgi:outer membrane protein TolC